MKENYVHVCFVIDESGSMYSSVNDVIGGFRKVIDEQRAVKNGTCSVSLFKFQSNVQEVYRGVDVNEVKYLDETTYSTGGCTAMNDGIGTAIDTIGKWLSDMPEEDRPEKNIIVVMTDGEENCSEIYSMSKIKEMIKHQEEKYNWTFVYMGTDVTNIQASRDLGFTNASYAVRSDHAVNYSTISDAISCYRNTDGDVYAKGIATNAFLCNSIDSMNAKFTAETGINTSGVITKIDSPVDTPLNVGIVTDGMIGGIDIDSIDIINNINTD